MAALAKVVSNAVKVKISIVNKIVAFMRFLCYELILFAASAILPCIYFFIYPFSRDYFLAAGFIAFANAFARAPWGGCGLVTSRLPLFEMVAGLSW